MTEPDKQKALQESSTDGRKISLIGTDPLAWLDEDVQADPIDKSEAAVSDDRDVSSDRPVSFSLPENLNIRDLETLQGDLMTLFDQGGTVILDASQVEKVDAVSMQMLAAFYQSGVGAGMHVSWSGSSEPFRDAGRLLGLTDVLGIHQE